jgi:hypothetical protein
MYPPPNMTCTERFRQVWLTWNGGRKARPELSEEEDTCHLRRRIHRTWYGGRKARPELGEGGVTVDGNHDAQVEARVLGHLEQ